MVIGWCFICAFVVLINKVCLQVTVEGFIGGCVVLPCSLAEQDFQLQDINVLWRHNDSEAIYDLIKGKDSLAAQNSRYKNRAQTFPEEYLRGNFSIKLTSLQHTDAGQFICYITHSSDSQHETVQLIVNESTAEKGNNSTEPANHEPKTRSYYMKILLIGSVCISVIIVFIIIFKKKKSENQSHLYKEQWQTEGPVTNC